MIEVIRTRTRQKLRELIWLNEDSRFEALDRTRYAGWMVYDRSDILVGVTGVVLRREESGYSEFLAETAYIFGEDGSLNGPGASLADTMALTSMRARFLALAASGWPTKLVKRRISP